MKNVELKKELLKLVDARTGLLTTKRVIDAARDPKSPLHDKFTWDDTVAARKWREREAQELINVIVEVPEVGKDTVPTFVSLSVDRGNGDGGGYRVLVDVMRDPDKRKQLLEDALHDMNAFQVRFARLKELSGVFSAMDRVKRKIA